VKVENVVDTVGAGDGFAVGVISALLEGKTLPQAVRAATKLARWPFRCRATAKDYQREHSSAFKFPLRGEGGAGSKPHQ
jgi:sugar/nucleoside kinase (ribokinase family)